MGRESGGDGGGKQVPHFVRNDNVLAQRCGFGVTTPGFEVTTSWHNVVGSE